MQKARTFIAVLLALAVAFVPMAASAGAAAPQLAAAAASVDCDHHQHRQALPEKAPPADEHCVAMANCGLCCVTVTSGGVVFLSHDAGMSAAIEPVRLSGPPLSWLTAPPLRPPRI